MDVRNNKKRKSRGRGMGLAASKYWVDIEATKRYFETGIDITGEFTKPPQKRKKQTAGGDLNNQGGGSQQLSSTSGQPPQHLHKANLPHMFQSGFEAFDYNTMETFAHSPLKVNWQTRTAEITENWASHRQSVLDCYIKQQPFSQKRFCDKCEVQLETRAIRCMSCKVHLCGPCDMVIHLRMCIHIRQIIGLTTKVHLKAHEFYDANWTYLNKVNDICLPCFLPPSCPSCKKGRFSLQPGKQNYALITREGRFDVKSAMFACQACPFQQEATIDDYIFSGFWPGDPLMQSHYLFSEELLAWWHLQQHKCPGSSERKFLEILQETSTSNGLSGIINRPLFSTVSKEFEYLRLQIEYQIQRFDKTICPACVDEPLAVGIDGNFKLRRLKSAGSASRREDGQSEFQRPGPNAEISRYKDMVICDDRFVEEHIRTIETKVPRMKNKEMCGGAVFKAACSDSSKYEKSDETGMLMMVCRHGVILDAINMHQGETYLHTHFLHTRAAKKKVKFVCQDVYCRYKPFKERIDQHFDNFQVLLGNMTGCIPIMHVKAHHWPCQILWSPLWTEGIAGTIGEEHEQVFSRMHLYSNNTKHMSSANRNDHLTLGIINWNREKHTGMARMLATRLKRAEENVKDNRRSLNDMLAQFNLKEIDLSEFYGNLKKLAEDRMNRRVTCNTVLEDLHSELEGHFIHIQNIKIAISKVAEHCKDRTRLRRTQTKLKCKALEIIKLINSKEPHCQISEADFESGQFYWKRRANPENDKYRHVSMTNRFKLVDTWMHLKRNQEEIIQTKLEIDRLTSYLTQRLSKLKAEAESTVEAAENPINLERRSHMLGIGLFMNEEVSRVSSAIQTLRNTFMFPGNHKHSTFDDESDGYTQTSSDESEELSCDDEIYDLSD